MCLKGAFYRHAHARAQVCPQGCGPAPAHRGARTRARPGRCAGYAIFSPSALQSVLHVCYVPYTMRRRKEKRGRGNEGALGRGETCGGSGGMGRLAKGGGRRPPLPARCGRRAPPTGVGRPPTCGRRASVTFPHQHTVTLNSLPLHARPGHARSPVPVSEIVDQTLSP